MRLQLGLLGLLAVLLGLTLWLRPDIQQKDAIDLGPLTSLRTQDISTIQLFNGDANQASIRLQKHGADWRLETPIQAPADSFAVGEILRLAETSIRGELPEADLGLLKLAPPLWRLQLNEQELAIGAVETLRGHRYIRRQDKVLLVDDFNPAMLDSNYADLSGRALLPTGPAIESLRLPGLHLERHGDGWRSEPELEKDRIRRLLGHWQSATAQWMLRPNEGHFDAVSERATLVIGGRSIDFLIVQRSPRLELIRPDWDLLYNLPGSAAAELLEP